MNRGCLRDVCCEPLEPRRLLSAGQLEPKFGAGGIASYDFGGNERAFGVLPAPNDTFLVYGRSDSPTTPVSLFRIHGNGALDTTFGAEGLVVLPDGSALAAGGGGAANRNYRVARVEGGVAAQPTEVTVRLNGSGSLIVNAPGTIDRVIDLYIRRTDGRLVVRAGDIRKSFDTARVRKIAIFTAGGSDRITLYPGIIGAHVDAGANGDVINGGGGNDILIGSAGLDSIFGLGGNDTLLGGGGRDYIVGGAGKDVISGGNDGDHLVGGGGHDRIFGGSDLYHDRIFGGPGDDAAEDDRPGDFYDSIEVMF